MLDSWMDQVVENFLNMTARAKPHERAEIIERVTAAFAPQTPVDPGASPDMIPTEGSTVSAIRREFGRVVPTEREQAELDCTHPHERKDPEMYRPRTPRRLPLGEKFS
jgi:hypothetical protein